VNKELKEVYKKVDDRIAKYGELTSKEINEIIQECRRKKKTSRRKVAEGV